MSEALTFASYNIHKAIGTDGRRDAGRILAVLRELDADVIALQEADIRFGQRESVLPRALIDDTPWKVVPVARRPRSIGWHGNALLVRRNMDILHSEALDLPTLEPRGAVCAEIGLGKIRFRVIGTHLDISGLRRSDQVQAILRYTRGVSNPCPVVVMGDFNQWTLRGGAIRRFAKDWTLCSPGPSFPSRRPFARFDRIACSPEWRVSHQCVHHSAQAAQASDHLPISISAQISGTA